MAATLVAALVVIAIVTAGGGGMARSDLHFQKELPQQKSDDNGEYAEDGSGGGYSFLGGGYGSNWVSIPGSGQNPSENSGESGSAPTDGSTPIPIQPGIGSGSGSGSGVGAWDIDHMPYIPEVPIYGSTPTDHIPHIPDVPIKATGPGSCDFWSSNHGSWPDILSKLSTVAAIFGESSSSMFPSGMTLLQALQNNNSDAYSSLLKQASASMLNAFTYKNFEFSPEDVKTKFGAALTSPETAAAQASEFARANLRFK